VLDNNGDKLTIISIAMHIVDSSPEHELRASNCEGQSVVEASGMQFSVLQMNKIGCYI
jgi:hypothetical protein